MAQKAIRTARVHTHHKKNKRNRALFIEIKALITNTSLRLRKIDLHLLDCEQSFTNLAFSDKRNNERKGHVLADFPPLKFRVCRINARGKHVSIYF